MGDIGQVDFGPILGLTGFEKYEGGDASADCGYSNCAIDQNGDSDFCYDPNYEEYNFAESNGRADVVLSVTNPKDIMTIVSVNSTKKYYTCVPSMAADAAENSEELMNAFLEQINIGFGSYI